MQEHCLPGACFSGGTNGPDSLSHYIEAQVEWLGENPDDPDAAAFKVEIEDWKRSYLVYRGHFGWGVFLLQVKE